jgi:hypothetical protein
MGHEELSTTEEQLRRVDFVLEPRCYQTIVDFRRAGGKPENAVEFLSDGYVGGWQGGSDRCLHGGACTRHACPTWASVGGWGRQLGLGG